MQLQCCVEAKTRLLVLADTKPSSWFRARPCFEGIKQDTRCPSRFCTCLCNMHTTTATAAAAAATTTDNHHSHQSDLMEVTLVLSGFSSFLIRTFDSNLAFMLPESRNIYNVKWRALFLGRQNLWKLSKETWASPSCQDEAPQILFEKWQVAYLRRSKGE